MSTQQYPHISCLPDLNFDLSVGELERKELGLSNNTSLLNWRCSGGNLSFPESFSGSFPRRTSSITVLLDTGEDKGSYTGIGENPAFPDLIPVEQVCIKHVRKSYTGSRECKNKARKGA